MRYFLTKFFKSFMAYHFSICWQSQHKFVANEAAQGSDSKGTAGSRSDKDFLLHSDGFFGKAGFEMLKENYGARFVLVCHRWCLLAVSNSLMTPVSAGKDSLD